MSCILDIALSMEGTDPFQHSGDTVDFQLFSEPHQDQIKRRLEKARREILMAKRNVTSAAKRTARTEIPAFNLGGLILEDVFVVQGLELNTLVAGKTTALRIFTFPDVISKTSRIEAVIQRPDGSSITVSWPKDTKNSTLGQESLTLPPTFILPSIAVLVAGKDVPFIGIYNATVSMFDAAGTTLKTFEAFNLEFLPTKDLRVMVSLIWSGMPILNEAIFAGHQAMRRLAALFPIRDGISPLDGDYSAGLRYNLDFNPYPQDVQLCPLFQRYLNRPAGVDSIDVGIAYRLPDPGEGSGGNAPHFCTGQNLPYSVIVWGANTLANVFCQETCHCFGLEPPQDPHLDPDHQHMHSKDVTIDPFDAGFGFDIDTEINYRTSIFTGIGQAFPNPTYDLMYYAGVAPDNFSISLNSWDWEYLRQQLAKLPSTGPV